MTWFVSNALSPPWGVAMWSSCRRARVRLLLASSFVRCRSVLPSRDFLANTLHSHISHLEMGFVSRTGFISPDPRPPRAPLRLARNAWSMVIRLRQTTNEYAPPLRLARDVCLMVIRLSQATNEYAPPPPLNKMLTVIHIAMKIQ